MALKNIRTEHILLGACLGAAISGGLYSAKRNRSVQLSPHLPYDQREFDRCVLAGIVIGAFAALLISKYAGRAKPKPSLSAINASILASAENLRLDKSDLRYQRLDRNATMVEQLLTTHYQGEIARAPFRQGSTQKGTALASAFDIDIVLPFLPSSFRSLTQMYDDVFNFLHEHMAMLPITSIRKQRKSIGLCYESAGKEYWIDVLPYKISNIAKSKTVGTLCVNSIGLLPGPRSRTKTDPYKLSAQELGRSQKNILVLMKHWKMENDLPLSSVLLERLIKNAYKQSKGRLPNTDVGKLLMVLKYVADRIDRLTVHGVENKSNILTNLSVWERTRIACSCKKLLYCYENDPETFCQVFTLVV